MTRKGLIRLWEDLSFGKRVIVDCAFTIIIMLLVDVIFSGRSGNFVRAIFEGAFMGFVFTILDHAVVTHRRANPPSK